MGSLTEQLEEQLQSFEGAEALLQQMARVLVPADAELRQLARAAAGQEVESRAAEDDSTNGEWTSPAELQLRKAQVRYRSLVEQIPAVTFMAPLDGTTHELYVSPQIEQLLGFRAEEWLADPIIWYRQLHPDDQGRWQIEFAHTLNSGEPFRSDYRLIAKDGRVVWVHSEAKVVCDDDGNPLFLQGVAFDITESKTAEERLRHVNSHLALARDQALEASRAKSAFLANMSHELRTPLNAIIGFSEMLTEDAEDGGMASFLPDLQKIHGSAKHLLNLISGVLDLSKIEAGKMTVFVETFDLAATIQEVAATVLPLAEKNGNVLDVHCAADLGSMSADVTKVRQVLLNLLSNAAKFTEKGTITLKASRVPGTVGDQVRVEVSDSGIGIAPDQVAQLFQTFNQGDNSTTRKYGGTGLGLAISQRFCQMMGGAIRVRSETGKGSTFTVQLPAEVVPVAEETPAPPSEVLIVPPPTSQPAQNLVLVIDDNPQVRELMTRFLSKKGLGVTTAPSGEEGLRLAKELLPSVIILDITLPEMDGWTVLTELKGDHALADTPVILCSGTSDLSQGYALGAADFLTKPVDWARLSALVQKHNGQEAPGRLLIVDDEPNNREVLRRMVAKEGWSVTEAENGRVALERVAEAAPDLILLDLMMPEMDGFEFVRALRQTPSGRSIPVAIVTAKELTAEDRSQLSGSVQKVLQKGAFNRDELLEEVHRLVAGCLPARPADKPAEPRAQANGASVDIQLLSNLRRLLEQAQAERDAALTQLRQQVESGADETQAEDWSEHRRELEEEADRARHQQREHQQSIELLRAECDDAWSQVESLLKTKEELELVRSERDAAQAQAQQSAVATEDWAPLPPVGVAVRQRELEKEVEDLRRRQLTSQARLEQVEAERDAAVAQVRTLKSRPPDTAAAESLSASGSRRSGQGPRPREEADRGSARWPADAGPWYVMFRDESGQIKRVTGSMDSIRQWLEQGLLGDVDEVRCGPSKNGPFKPLGQFAEFHDLVDEPAPLERFSPEGPPAEEAWAPLPRSGPSLGAGKEPRSQGKRLVLRDPQARSLDWLTWLLVLLLAMISALFAGLYLFPGK